ncbi:hypothetical protein NE237_000203 [Protea cynaroides]|uniref:VWFA domain-containing protein n=1 Tax=Protea cynaroides TaxID=273540 RepID=A0A9Q0KQR6_9MAGN|nr:hypothetical protein NE237_000203 [Protea cynaroides]
MEKLKSILFFPVDWNCKLIINENAIISTHAPSGKKVDVRPLHSLINKILMPTATTNDQVDLDSHLKGFQNSFCFQELFKIVHKNYCQLSCKCSGGGDANSTTVALFKTWSVYSWEVKMVLALAAFAIIYGESLLMADQTNPLAESIKLLKQLPNKSKLSKIRPLILAMVKLTNAIFVVDDSQSENISTYIQTVVCVIVRSVVVCTSQIIGFDDEYTEDELSKLTELVDRMNSHLGQLLDIEDENCKLTIDENEIRNTHSPDGKEVEVGPLHKLINEILIASNTIIVEGASGDQAMLDSQLKSFKNSSQDSLEELTKIVRKIYCELSCECLGGGDVNSKMVALFKTLSQYSWEAKMVLVLAAFSIIYGEFLLTVNHNNPLVKLLKQALDKSKLLKIKSLIDAMVKVTNTIVDMVNVGKSRPVDISTYIETIVSWTVGSIIVCTSQIIGLDDEYTENELAKLTKKVDRMNTKLGQDLHTWWQSVDEKKKELNQYFQKMTDNDELPHAENIGQVAAALKESGLGTSNLVLGIDFTDSNRTQGKISFNNKSLHAIGSTRNPYQQAIAVIGETLSEFAVNKKIPCYGFGDKTTEDKTVFSFLPDNTPCKDFEEVLKRYEEIAPNLELFVDAVIDIVEKSDGQHHVLVIIADGQVMTTTFHFLSPSSFYIWSIPGININGRIVMVSKVKKGRSKQEEETFKSIVTASSYALSIVLVGVGDGPWDEMKRFCDNIPGRKFDNFQFVNLTDIMKKELKPSEKEAAFAQVALRKIPNQYKKSEELKLLGHTTGKAKKVVPLNPPVK